MKHRQQFQSYFLSREFVDNLVDNCGKLCDKFQQKVVAHFKTLLDINQNATTKFISNNF